MVNTDTLITKEMLAHYIELNRKKKEVEKQLDELKKVFNQYFDRTVGQRGKGELTVGSYKLQRQIRKTEKYEQEVTVKRLEDLNLTELIQKRPDEGKIRSALEIGILEAKDLEGCKTVSSSQAIYVKKLDV